MIAQFAKKLYENFTNATAFTPKEDINREKHNVYFEIININPNIYLAHRGARICVGLGPVDGGLRDQSLHVAKVLARQHESIMEHTNLVAILHIPEKEIDYRVESYTEFLSSLKYCNYIPKKTNNGEILILLGGSIRGYIHSVRECKKGNYFIDYLMKPLMQSSIEKEFLKQLIELGIFNEDECNYITDAVKEDNIDDSEDCERTEVYEPEEKQGKRVDLVYKAPLYYNNDTLIKYFTLLDIYQVSTITFIVHDVSRACSNQITRHRIGISQESQRYVSRPYDSDDFVNAIKLSMEDNQQYNCENPNVNEIMGNINELFDNYKILCNNRIYKEDARYWLPMGVTTKLMVTFTYETLAKFFKLRLDKTAQKEIRLVAKEMSKWLDLNKDDLDEFIELNNDYRCNIVDDKDPLFIIDDSVIDEELKDKEQTAIITKFNINNAEDAERLLKESDKLNGME